MKEKKLFTLPIVFLCSLFVLGGAAVLAQMMHHGHDGHSSHSQSAETFRASTEKSFPVLMDEAMSIMHTGMDQAAITGDPDHDFTTMMIPHHQGAVDMAKVLLLYGNDPELRNLALQIITGQQYEIQLMQAWLKNHPSPKGKLLQNSNKNGGN